MAVTAHVVLSRAVKWRVTALVVLEVAEGLDDLLVERLVICLDRHLPVLGILFSRRAFSVISVIEVLKTRMNDSLEVGFAGNSEEKSVRNILK